MHMTISDANERFRDMSLEEALNIPCAFGKYVSRPMCNVPYAYIKWISSNVEPALAGAGVVYRMIYAARTIVQEMHIPDSMPHKQKYTASPRDIMAYDQLQATVPRKRLQKGHYIITNGKNNQIYPSTSRSLQQVPQATQAAIDQLLPAMLGNNDERAPTKEKAIEEGPAG